jgi:hypothetical protein
MKNDVSQFTFIFFAKSDLLNITTKILIEAFRPKKVVKQNIYR